jgi:short-subunit dehydrogenase
MSDLAEKVVIVTGASGGIGQALCRRLAVAGCRLGLVSRTAAALESLAGELRARGVRVAVQPADVCDRAALAGAVRALEAELGAVDLAIHNAGLVRITDPLAPDVDDLEAMIQVHYLGCVYLLEAVLPTMLTRGRGHFVAVNTLGSRRGMAWSAAYSASKAAQATYLESLRPALRRKGIRVTTIFPGFIRTDTSQALPLRLPVIWLDPDTAARRMVRAILRGRREFSFPWWDAFWTGVTRRMPNWIFDPAMRFGHWLIAPAGKR